MADEDQAAPDPLPAMTRSEEELHIDTVRRPVERIRLRKRIVTEMVTRTFPVRHEELVIEREPVSRDEPAEPRDAALPEIILYREELVPTTLVVPAERVLLVREVVTETREVADTIRREHIVLEGDTGAST